MADADLAQPPVPEQDVPAPPRRSPLAAALPFLVTACAAVLLSLLLQVWLFPRNPAALVANPTTTVSAPGASATPTSPLPVPSVTPAPTIAPAAESLLRLEILDLQAENRRLWSTIYLLRAVAQLDDALVSLQANDPVETDRILVAAYRSLDQAYAFSAEQEKGPLDTFRLQLSLIRDDLRLRPEGLDRRLRQLRRLVLSLVNAE